MNFPFSQVAGYAEMQDRIINRSHEMIIEAMACKDVTLMEALLHDTMMGFDFAIELIQGQFDFDIWHEGNLRISRSCQLTKLDTTGELAACIETIESLDARAYYESDVTKLFSTDLEMMAKGREDMFNELTEIISVMKAA